MSRPIILITGASHTGKSTLAQQIAEQMNLPVTSTDQLARHPGRPWPTPRPQVAEFYESLTPQTIYWFLKVHHENMWPQLKEIIERASAAGQGLIMEGSALRPEHMAQLTMPNTRKLCLYAETELLTARIHESSQYLKQPKATRACIDAFIDRSLRDNEDQQQAALTHGIPCHNSAEPFCFEPLNL